MKVLIDMNLSPAFVPVIHEDGHDATHWSTIGAQNAPDAEILSYCRSSGSVLLTHDLDFGAILAQTGDNTPSVIQVREQDVAPESIGPAVLAALR
jgi:predicted nuclease of predicted toxin-antitoxin system